MENNDTQANHSLADYLPEVITHFLHRRDHKSMSLSAPKMSTRVVRASDGPMVQQRFDACCLFIDICNFTGLSETLASLGTHGVEILANYLNTCFAQMVRLVTKAGGDILKFAGDAVLVLWPVDTDNDLRMAAHRAVQCAFDIQETLPKDQFYDNLSLRLKIGIGVGQVTIVHVGGETDVDMILRKEYITMGNALNESFAAEGHCKANDIVVSAAAWDLISHYFVPEGEPFEDGFVKVTSQQRRIKKRRSPFNRLNIPPSAMSYVPRSVHAFLKLEYSTKDWISEVRLVTVLFINFGFDDDEIRSLNSTEGKRVLQRCFCAVQRVLFDYEGSINKFLVDDKGVTLLAVFGLPPIAHENDATRGVLASLGIGTFLHEMALSPAIGVASGSAFCGVIGHSGGRKEYTVIGDTVNLASRLVQHAQRESLLVITDSMTRYLCKDAVDFEMVSPNIRVKGKKEKIKIYFPYRKLTSNPMHLASEDGDLLSGYVGDKSNERLSMQLMTNSIFISSNPVTGDGFDAWRNEWEEQVYKYSQRRKDSITKREINYLIPAGQSQDSTRHAGDSIVAALGGDGINGVVIEGDIGVGKSRLLSCVYQTLARNHNTLFCGAANPFERGSLARKFGVYIDMIKERLDQVVADHPTVVKHGRQREMDLRMRLHQSLEKRRNGQHAMMQTAVWGKSQTLLEIDTLGTQTPKSDASSRASNGSSCIANAHDDAKKPKKKVPSPEHRKQKVIKGWLKLSKATGAERVSTSLYLLNDVLGLEFARSEKSKQQGPLSGSEKDQRIIQLFVNMFHGMSLEAGQEAVCLVDDAMFMDEGSLKITDRLIAAPYVWMIMATRPINSQTFPDLTLRKVFRGIKGKSCVYVHEVEPLDSAQLSAIIRSKLGVLTIPAEIEVAITVKSRGNPLFGLEILNDMLNRGIIRVDRARQTCYTSSLTATVLDNKKESSMVACHRCHAKFSAIRRKHNCKRCGKLFCSSCAPANLKRNVIGYNTPQRHCVDCFRHTCLTENAGVAASSDTLTGNILNLKLDPPVSVVAVMGTWLDNLSVHQQLLLRIASLAHRDLQFSKAIVFKAFPLQDVSQGDLDEHFAMLVDLGFVKEITKVRGGGNAAKDEVAGGASLDGPDGGAASHEFVHYMMPEVLALRMLVSQQEDLGGRVHELMEVHEKQVRQRFFEQAFGHLKSSNYKAGHMSIYKNNPSIKGLVGGQWKKRWGLVKNNRMDLYGDESKESLKETLLLAGASVELEEPEEQKALPSAGSNSSLGAWASKDLPAELCLILKVESTLRHGVMLNKARTYYITFPEAMDQVSEARSWLYMLKFAIENASGTSMAQDQASRAGTKPAKTPAKHHRRVSSGLGQFLKSKHASKERKRMSFGSLDMLNTMGGGGSDAGNLPVGPLVAEMSKKKSGFGRRLRSASWFGSFSGSTGAQHKSKHGDGGGEVTDGALDLDALSREYEQLNPSSSSLETVQSDELTSVV